MEVDSSLTDSVSTTSLGKGRECIKECCKPRYQKASKGAILVLVWSFLATSVYHYYGISIERDSVIKNHPIDSELLVIALLLPIGGWLADAYLGRYTVIHYGMWTMWLGAVLSTLSLVFAKVSTLYGSHGDRWVSFVSKAIMGAGLGVFQANIIQFGIDQLSVASSTAITSFITWYSGTLFASGIVIYVCGECTSTDYAGILVVVVFLTLALCSNFFLNHLLVKEHPTDNPLPLIWKVVRYTIKNKHQWQRLLPSQEHTILSKFNIAKTMYAGPFSDEQVEDVKTFFRVMLIITTCMAACSGLTNVSYARTELMKHLQNWPNSNDTSLSSCYTRLSLTYVNYPAVVATFLLYKTVIQPLFYNVLPRVNMTTKFVISIILFFITIMALLGIELAAYLHQTKNQCVFQGLGDTSKADNHVVYTINYLWMIVPGMAHGYFVFLLVITYIEFICAQAPFNMKGLVLGTVYTLFGLGALIQTALSTPFLYKQPAWEKAPLTCGIWYFMLQGVIVIVVFIVIVVMTKKYKLRERSNQLHKLINVH